MDRSITKSATAVLLGLAFLVAVLLAAVESDLWPLRGWLIATPLTLIGQSLARLPTARQAVVDRSRAVRLAMAAEVASVDGSRHRVAEVLERARHLIRLAERLEERNFELEPRPVGAQVVSSIDRFEFSENPVTDLVAAHQLELEADELARSALQRYRWRRGQAAA
jgi:hypothetical protein